MYKKISFFLILLLIGILSIGAISAYSNLTDNTDFESKSIKTHNINSSNYDVYFNGSGNLKESNNVSSGDIINLEGDFTSRNFVFNLPLNITSKNKNAKLFNSTVVILSNGCNSNVSNINFKNSKEFDNGGIGVFVESSNYITVSNINFHGNGKSGMVYIYITLIIIKLLTIK